MMTTVHDDEPAKNLPLASLTDNDTLPMEAVEESHPSVATNPNPNNAITPGAFQVRTPWSRASPAPSEDADDTTEPTVTTQEPTAITAEQNNWTLLEATIVLDGDGNVYEAVPVAHGSSRLRLLPLMIVSIVVLTIGLAVGLTRSTPSDPPIPSPVTRRSKLAWITNSSIERVANSLPYETVTAILANTTLNNSTTTEWYEQDLWSPDNIYEPETAQGKAWKWLLSDATVTLYTDEEATTRFALAVLQLVPT